LPPRARELAGGPLAAVLRTRLRRRELRAPRDWDTDEERQAQAFFLSPNNFAVGGVRFNLEGRGRAGKVPPGPVLDELYQRLESDFLALVNVDTGGPVITRVERSDAHYERGSLDALPDVFLEWNHEHPIETIWSPRFGLIRGPYRHWRTGDHRPGGLLLVRSPGVAPGAELPALEINRLGASIAATLGVELDGTARSDARAAAILAGCSPAPPARPVSTPASQARSLPPCKRGSPTG
jgi:hypothetical protein